MQARFNKTFHHCHLVQRSRRSYWHEWASAVVIKALYRLETDPHEDCNVHCSLSLRRTAYRPPTVSSMTVWWFIFIKMKWWEMYELQTYWLTAALLVLEVLCWMFYEYLPKVCPLSTDCGCMIHVTPRWESFSI